MDIHLKLKLYFTCYHLPSQLLAQARVSDVDNHQRGVLHMAAEGDFPTILSVLLENGADPDLMDEGGNNGGCGRVGGMGGWVSGKSDGVYGRVMG